MAAKHSSSAGGAMRASLVLVLLLTAVASAHADKRTITCENKCSKPVKMNGKDVPAFGKALIEIVIGVDVELYVVGADGKPYSKKFPVPLDVTVVAVVYDGVFIKVKVKAVTFLLGLVQTLLGFVCVSLQVRL